MARCAASCSRNASAPRGRNEVSLVALGDLPATSRLQRARHPADDRVERLLLRGRVLDRDTVPDLVAAGENRFSIEDAVALGTRDDDRVFVAMLVGDRLAVEGLLARGE